MRARRWHGGWRMTTEHVFDAATLRFYEQEAVAYAARWPEGTGAPLTRFLDRLSPGARILELGCGGGQDAAAMIARGFNVDLTDGSPALAAGASRKLGRSVRVMRFDELDADNAYDAVWAAACLLHVPRDALADMLARVWRALRPGGWHWASYKATGQAGRDRFGRLFNQPTADQLAAIYNVSGAWTLDTVEERVGGGYDGVATPWIAVTARRI